jgi:hypothetical protein
MMKNPKVTVRDNTRGYRLLKILMEDGNKPLCSHTKAMEYLNTVEVKQTRSRDGKPHGGPSVMLPFNMFKPPY